MSSAQSVTIFPVSLILTFSILLSLTFLLNFPSRALSAIPIPNPSSYTFYYNDSRIYVDSQHQSIRIDHDDQIFLSKDDGESWFIVRLDEKNSKLAKDCVKEPGNVFDPARFNHAEEWMEFTKVGEYYIPHVISAVAHDIIKLFNTHEKPDNWGMDFERQCFILRDFHRLTWLCVSKKQPVVPVLYGPVREQMLPISDWHADLSKSELDKIFKIPAVCERYLRKDEL
mmetsp:Transcript_3454/g.13168  ORF Transcript_3454/g.13168 Transcript_3454/m.13168 type:complete len:227 (-) Transcript_3454:672-1352(-)